MIADGGALPVRTYEELVGLRLNREYLRACRVCEIADGVRIGTGRATTPAAWVEMLSDGDRVGYTLWRTEDELRDHPPDDL